MPSNTRALIIVLVVFALAVAVINIYRWFMPKIEPVVLSSQTRIYISPTQTPMPAPAFLTYTNGECGIQLNYPTGFAKSQDASGSAILALPDGSEALFITCQAGEKITASASDKIETIQIASVSAKLYRQTVEGANINTLMLRHPQTKRDIFVAGSGQAFEDAINSLQIIQ